jgi:peptidoglycan hydrolase CwlO-like protein
MVWYPSVDDIVRANKKAVQNHKHGHKLLRSTISGETAMAQVELKKSFDELLDELASDNAELFELLATNGKGRVKK